MIRLALSILALVLLGVSASAQEQTPDDREYTVYTVSAFIYENRELLGMPSFSVREGDTAAIATSDGQQYALEVRVDRANAEQLAALGNPEGVFISAATRVFVPDMVLDEWRVIATPQVFMQDGQIVSVEVDTSRANYRRDEAQDYVDAVRVDLVITEVDETWIDRAGSEKSHKACSIDQFKGPKSLALSAATGQLEGFPSIGVEPDNCCTNGCLTCCGSGPTCCADTARCATGCCTGTGGGGAP